MEQSSTRQGRSATDVLVWIDFYKSSGDHRIASADQRLVWIHFLEIECRSLNCQSWLAIMCSYESKSIGDLQNKTADLETAIELLKSLEFVDFFHSIYMDALKTDQVF